MRHKLEHSGTEEIPVHNVPEDALGEEAFEDHQNMYTPEDLEELETETSDNMDEEDLNYHMMSHADFLNRLCNEKFIPRIVHESSMTNHEFTNPLTPPNSSGPRTTSRTNLTASTE